MLDSVFVGADWSVTPPAVRLVGVESGEQAWWPVGAPWQFSIREGRRCVGWYDMRGYGGGPSRYVSCDDRSIVKKGRQCFRCQRKEGFLEIHQAGRTGRWPSDEALAEYLKGEHWIYVAVHGDAIPKVGTVASARGHSRLAEQGAVDARYIGSVEDGIRARQIEDRITAGVGIKQVSTARRKIDALAAGVDLERNASELESARDRVVEFCRSEGVALRAAAGSTYSLPPIARSLVRREPRPLYSREISPGTAHQFSCEGMLGSAALAAEGNDSSLLDLTQLRGKVLGDVSLGAKPEVVQQGALFL